MKKFNQIIFVACGLLLTLAAFPVFAQQKAASEIQINIKPFEELAAAVKEKVAAKKVDLNAPFSVELEGVLTKDGKLDAAKSRFVKSAGDAAMIEIGKQFIEAVADSNLLAYLKETGIERINFTLAQDDSRTYAKIVSEQPTAEKAMTINSTLKTVASIVLMVDKNGQKKLGDDERILINGFKTSSADKTLTLDFDYDKSVVQALIRRKLEAAK